MWPLSIRTNERHDPPLRVSATTPHTCMGRRQTHDDESSRDTGTLGVVLDTELSMRMPLVCPETGQRSHDNSMLQSNIAEFDRLKEFRR